jgi:hypothetical protein
MIGIHGSRDEFWHQVRLAQMQLQGMLDGYQANMTSGAWMVLFLCGARLTREAQAWRI